MTIQIDKNIPVPAAKFQSNFAEDVKKMEVGDSVFLDSPQKSKSFAQALRNQGYKQVTRKVKENDVEGYRVWKMEKIA